MKQLLHHKNNHGFTIAELLIAIALTSIVGLGIFEVLRNTNIMSKDISEKLDQRIEAKLGDKLMVRDLRNAGPSLNNIYLRDDNGNNFFDFDQDRSSAFYRAQTNRTRKFTLEKGKKMYMHIMTVDHLRGKSLFADAVTFFQVGASPANVYQPATLSYRGINYNNYLTAVGADKQPINNPLLIHPENMNKLVLVDSSAYMPVSPIRPAVFIGKVGSVGSVYDIQKVTPPETKEGVFIFNYNIRTPINTTVNPANFEQYMYNLPPVGANGASVRIQPVRIFKYELDCTDPEMCILYRQDILHGASTQKIPVIRGFTKVIFYRDDLATSIFKVISCTEKDTTCENQL